MKSPQGIPLLGFGTFPLKGSECERHVLMALELGFRHIDTAQMYGNEADVGRALAASRVGREAIYVVSKMDSANLRAAGFADAARRTADDLGGAPDLLLIHWPPTESEVPAVIDRLVAAKEEGLARAIGISNFPTRLMRLAQQRAKGALICNQVEFHPLIDQSAVLATARDLGMTLAAYCPLGRGKALEPEAVRTIAHRLGEPASAVVLRWIIQQGVAAIPMTTKRDNAAANLRALEFDLSDADMAAISRLTSGHQRLISPASMAGRWDN